MLTPSSTRPPSGEPFDLNSIPKSPPLYNLGPDYWVVLQFSEDNLRVSTVVINTPGGTVLIPADDPLDSLVDFLQRIQRFNSIPDPAT